MEVYIDNVKIELKQKSFKTLGKAISEIQKKLSKENKVLQEIYVNGNILEEDTNISGKDLKVIEITTKSHVEVILESLSTAKSYIDKYYDVIDYLEIDSQEPLNEEDEMHLMEALVFLKWLYNIFLLIQEDRLLDFVYSDFDEYVEEFYQGLEKAQDAYEAGDLVELLNIMEFTMGDLLGEFYDNADEYYNDIAEQENRKRLLN